MIFVDSNVFMYAVGRPHPLQPAARQFFLESLEGRVELVTSAEVLQELAHSYLPVGRLGDFDEALERIADFGITVWPLEQEDVELARILRERYPSTYRQETSATWQVAKGAVSRKSRRSTRLLPQ